MAYFMNKLTKLFVAGLASVSLIASTLSVANAAELDDAVSWMYDNGLTMFSNVATFSPN